MGASLGSLVVSLGLDAAEYFAGLNKADYEAQKMAKSIDRGLASAGKAFEKITAGAAAAYGTMSLLAKVEIDHADALNKMSQKLGISVESLSALEYAGKLADVSLETLGIGMKKLSVGMAEMQAGTGDARVGLKALNIDVESTKGTLKSSEQVLFEIADRFADMEDGAGKTALAVKIFGKSGAELIPLLNQGAKGLRDNAEEARRFGLIISTQAAQAAEKFNDNLTRIKESGRALGIGIANDTLPWLTKMSEQMIEGTRIAGSFAGALRLFGLSSITSSNAGEKIKEIREEIEALERARNAPGVGTAMQARADAQIADLKKQMEFAKFLQRQSAPELPAGVRDETSRFTLPDGKKFAPALPDEAKLKEAESLLKKYNDQIRRYADETDRAQGTDSELKSVRRMLETDADFKKMSESQKQALMNAAELVDRAKARAEYEKELNEGLARNEQDRTDAMNKQIDDLRTLRDRYIEMADPIEKYRKQLQELDRLREKFPELNKVWDEAQFKINLAIDEAAGFNQKLEETNNFAKELGLTFSSAFEDAILKGKDFRGVLQGIAEDIARMLARKTITEPIANGIGGLLKGLSFTKLLGLGSQSPAPVAESTASSIWAGMGDFDLPSFDVGTPFVPHDMIAKIHRGERITPAAQNNGNFGGGPKNVFYVDNRGASLEAVQDLRKLVIELSGSIEERSVAAVMNANVRGIRR